MVEKPMVEFFPNSDFDLALQGIPQAPGGEEGAHRREMAWHFLFTGDPGDSVVVHRPVPEGFLSYLDAKGIRLPATVLHPGFTRDADFIPFGWNRQTVTLSGRYDRPPVHPDLAAVRRANSRSYALELERQWRGEGCRGRLFAGFPELRSFLESRPAAESWVAKAEHGFAGTANRRVSGGRLSAEDAARLHPLFVNGNPLVLEPWDERLQDMAVLFQATETGEARDIRGHVLLNSRDGAFLGVEIAPNRQPPEPWRKELADCAGTLAAALRDLGYAGPVGMDAYSYRTETGESLRPLVDVNARLSMALPAHGLARRLPARYVRWSWHKPRKLNYPVGYADFEARLGTAAFDPETGEGILAVSPLFREDAGAGRPEPVVGPPAGSGASPGAGPEIGTRPKRVGFALIARTRESLDRLQAAFDSVLRRTR